MSERALSQTNGDESVDPRQEGVPSQVLHDDLRRREAQIAEIESIAHIGSWEWDVLTGHLSWSRELCSIYGVDPSAFQPGFGDFLERVHPDDRAMVERLVADAYRTCADFTFEHRILRTDGELRLLQARGRVLRDLEGAPIRMVGTGQDITERRRAEDELRRARDELEERVALRTAELEAAVRARDEFLSLASHELKTPLSSLKLQVQVRQRYLSRGKAEAFTPDKLRLMFEADDRQLDRLTRLIEDMLDISRIHAGRLDLKREPFDLGALVGEVTERFRPHAGMAGVELRAEHPEPVFGRWDRFRMEQVITNLLSNAIKFGDGKPVRVRAWREGSLARVAVEDGGRGIAPEDQERIFHRFERASASRDEAGLGLGLYIARQIVELHAGTIQVDSAPGKGATFLVDLPITP